MDGLLHDPVTNRVIIIYLLNIETKLCKKLPPPPFLPSSFSALSYIWAWHSAIWITLVHASIYSHDCTYLLSRNKSLWYQLSTLKSLWYRLSSLKSLWYQLSTLKSMWYQLSTLMLCPCHYRSSPRLEIVSSHANVSQTLRNNFPRNVVSLHLLLDQNHWLYLIGENAHLCSFVT